MLSVYVTCGTHLSMEQYQIFFDGILSCWIHFHLYSALLYWGRQLSQVAPSLMLQNFTNVGLLGEYKNKKKRNKKVKNRICFFFKQKSIDTYKLQFTKYFFLCYLHGVCSTTNLVNRRLHGIARMILLGIFLFDIFNSSCGFLLWSTCTLTVWTWVVGKLIYTMCFCSYELNELCQVAGCSLCFIDILVNPLA